MSVECCCSQLRPTTFSFVDHRADQLLQVFDVINVMTRAGRGHRHHHHGVPGVCGDVPQFPPVGATVATIMFKLLAVTYCTQVGDGRAE